MADLLSPQLKPDTHVTARTRFVEANGVRFAYRLFGRQTGVPLLFMQHFRGGMDHWDPTVTDGFGRDRPVIVFDNAGVAGSSGETPDTVEAMAEHAHDFIDALGLSRIDRQGFSLGGYVAQAFASNHSDLVRRLILVGTGPRGGEPPTDPNYRAYATSTDPDTGEGSLEAFLYLFFSQSARGQAAGRAFWERRHRRQDDVDDPSSVQTMAAQSAAGVDWREVRGERFSDLERSRPDARGERQQRRHGPDDQRLVAVPAHPQRPADRLPGRGARLPLPVPRAVPRARAAVPRLTGALALTRSPRGDLLHAVGAAVSGPAREQCLCAPPAARTPRSGEEVKVP